MLSMHAQGEGGPPFAPNLAYKLCVAIASAGRFPLSMPSSNSMQASLPHDSAAQDDPSALDILGCVGARTLSSSPKTVSQPISSIPWMMSFETSDTTQIVSLAFLLWISTLRSLLCTASFLWSVRNFPGTAEEFGHDVQHYAHEMY